MLLMDQAWRIIFRRPWYPDFLATVSFPHNPGQRLPLLLMLLPLYLLLRASQLCQGFLRRPWNKLTVLVRALAPGKALLLLSCSSHTKVCQKKRLKHGAVAIFYVYVISSRMLQLVVNQSFVLYSFRTFCSFFLHTSWNEASVHFRLRALTPKAVWLWARNDGGVGDKHLEEPQ